MNTVKLNKSSKNISRPSFFSIKLPLLAVLFGSFLFALYFINLKFIVVFSGLALAAFMAFPFFGSLQGILIWVAYLGHLGSSMLSYYTGINPMIAGMMGFILLASVTVKVNGTTYTKVLLPKIVRRILAATLVFATCFYLYTVKGWTVGNFILLALPMILFLFINVHDVMDEGKDWTDRYDTFSG
jgi:hypothetical protein